ncbi:MAG: ATP-NAD kinase [Candidatus Gerdarchaeota archaeon]|nr:MAG: ATP-NAD kinase [Candidatus Gerdarchaeota archaeon]RLI68690.1 MAG: ATP-NAD kinase [Candidatus Gerdarchaeota archaeon]
MITAQQKTNKKETKAGKLLIGFIINPIAGVGGRIGLKGSDNAEEVWEKLASGEGKKVSLERAERFLKTIPELKEKINFLTYESEMGADVLEKEGFNFEIIGKIQGERPTREDTIRAARECLKRGVKLVVFFGGDGTACDMFEAVQDKVPLLAVPSGVKMHSACFALNPEIGAMILKQFTEGQLNLTHAEVMDIDEEAFRAGRVSASLKGMVEIPYLKSAFQGGKMASPATQDEKLDQKIIARRVCEDMERDTLYLLGSGTTCKAVADYLGIEKTLLGVDVIYNRKLLALDQNEQQLLEWLDKYPKAKIIVTVIGNQGFIFGRGNQQFSPAVIRKVGLDNIILIATISKLEKTEKLRVDTGDPELDKELQGFVRVITSYHEDLLMRIEE